ncbi:glycoside hydrolase family 3 C-terminal domain-containing protein [Paenarthrobacter aurescens]|nr:glycoside hydrolase family 3 C-terminal domain-containing protein [Paenarthrobacter aurescens]MDO6145400.1 glycoside hydrolase family 3 C-terminal domain-containing protein [Paenarthrobacter aurescens]MDO6149205.1 glycoside hydrolase family 3 C-terminal domain-containing protein [Paenarthrobacter aurescens]MDO6160449.1 glycoside hydrolase family 3 C-terminal domain-containing protein [Paenarthrobacter aurescens]MDO6164308.1 glycoside hydrolase family 3 C-terminal domain-containing protein [P
MTQNQVGTAQRLLHQLTLTQKIAMLHQHAPAVPELGVAPFRTGTEAAHGVAWLGPATVFPQPVGLAATWDEDLITRVGQAVGHEVRAKKAADSGVSLNVWAPVVNPLRHPLWGRNEEGFSEDPHLTARFATAFCAGLKGTDSSTWLTVPTLKHFLGYNNEHDRSLTSSNLRDRVLHEYELPAYRQAIEDGVAGAVMLSYNLVNGRPAHVSDLVNQHLRAWTNGEEITVVSDAGAPSALFRAEKYFPDAAAAYAAALKAGVDNFTDDGDNPDPSIAYLEEALERGLLTEEDLDRSVTRLLTLRARTGEFDDDGGSLTETGAGTPDAGKGALDAASTAALAREAARKSVVLLRNQAQSALLPLGDNPGSIAVIGALGQRVLSDWYSGTLQNQCGIAEAFSRRYKDVTAEDGLDVIALRSARTGTYVGLPPSSETTDDAGVLVADKASPAVGEHFTLKDWGRGEFSLQSGLTGRFVAADGDGYLRASADRIGGWVVQETFRLLPSHDGTVALQHVASSKWVRVESGTGSLVLASGLEAAADRFVPRTIKSGHEAAQAAAASADVAVVVVGNDPHLGGRETLDRDTLDLPQSEQELVRIVRDANPATVLLIVSSYPYALGALADLPAIAWTSHGGQELGPGVVDVLSGDTEPTGRLPQTWFARDRDLPDILDYDIIGSESTYLYTRAEPLYPLGHGLNYGKVQYIHAVITGEIPGKFIDVQVTLANHGDRVAHELVQAYAAAPAHPYDFPRRLLVAHQRVEVAPHGSSTAKLRIPVERLATFSTVTASMVVEPGEYVILLGSSASMLPVSVTFRIPDGGRQPGRMPGTWVPARLYDATSNMDLVPARPLSGTAIAPANPSAPARAVYRTWDGQPITAVHCEVLSARAARSLGGCSISVQTSGPAGSWLQLGQCELKEGYSGEVRIDVDPSGLPAWTASGTLRLELRGDVTVHQLKVS